MHTECSGTVSISPEGHRDLPGLDQGIYPEWLSAPWAEQASIGEIMGRIALVKNLSVHDLLASFINHTLSTPSPLAQLLQYVIDVAGDQFTAEEFYLRYPELMVWLAKAGCTEDEIQVRAYVHQNPQIFTCRRPGCTGKIVGGCPKMYCEECESEYVLHVDTVTKRMCSQCVARELGECTEQSMRTRKPIYGIMPGGVN